MKKILMLAALAAASNMAVAEDFGFYTYGSLGKARVTMDQAGNDSQIKSITGASQVSSSVDDNPTTLKLQLGYQFDQNWGIEGGYTHAQKLLYSGTARIGSSNLSVSANDKLSIWNVSAAFTIPLGATGLQGTGRIGVANVREEQGASIGWASGSTSDNKTNLTVGLGLKYNLNKNVSVRADLDHYKATDNDFNVWSVGGGYKF